MFLGGGEGWDGVSLAFDNLPLAMTLSFVGIFVLVGLAFRSVLIPLRTTLTIALTLAFVFGAAVLVRAWYFGLDAFRWLQQRWFNIVDASACVILNCHWLVLGL